MRGAHLVLIFLLSKLTSREVTSWLEVNGKWLCVGGGWGRAGVRAHIFNSSSYRLGMLVTLSLKE